MGYGLNTGGAYKKNVNIGPEHRTKVHVLGPDKMPHWGLTRVQTVFKGNQAAKAWKIQLYCSYGTILFLFHPNQKIKSTPFNYFF